MKRSFTDTVGYHKFVKNVQEKAGVSSKANGINKYSKPLSSLHLLPVELGLTGNPNTSSPAEYQIEIAVSG